MTQTDASRPVAAGPVAAGPVTAAPVAPDPFAGTESGTQPRFIGAELLAASDQDREPAGGAALAALVTQVLDGLVRQAEAGLPVRVLVAGPHRDELVRCLDRTEVRLTWLVRAASDALALAGQVGTSVQLLCGSLTALTPGGLTTLAPGGSGAGAFDLVVALDGVRRLNGVEEVEPDWSHSVQALSALLRPAGRLLLGVPNPLGVHRQVALTESTMDPTGESGWVRPTELEAAAPASPGRLYELLAAAGLRATDGWVAYPQPHEPTVLARFDTLDADLARVGVLGALCGRAFDPVIEDRAVLVDPRPLVALAARAGSADLLAPLWIVDARCVEPRPGWNGDRPTEPDPPCAVAPLIVADRAGPFSMTYEIVGDPEHQWRRRPLAGEARAAGGIVAAGGLRRDPTRLSGRLPVGPTLAETLRQACADDDKGLLRSATLRWIALAGPDPFATADNLVLVGTDWQVADPSYSLVTPVEADVAVARCLRQFAVGLLAGGYAHPWLPSMDADALARMLAGLADVTLPPAALVRAVELEVAISAAIRELSDDEQRAMADRLSAVDPGNARAGGASVRELRASVDWLRAELDESRTVVSWYEGRLAEVDADLRRTRRLAEAGGPRLATLGRGSLRWLRARARAALGRVGLLAWARRQRRRLKAR